MPRTLGQRTQPGAGDVARPGGAGGRHLHEVDIVRLVTFGSVILVHATYFTNGKGSVATGAALMLLHYTREAFFAITGFVLFHVYYRRDYRLGAFWRRRYYLVGVPYLVWTVIYYPFSVHWRGVTAGGALARLGYDLVTGQACYHLYFLLVSLQIYAAFPLLVWLVRRTEGHHAVLFLGSLALQLAMMAAVGYGPAPTGAAGVLVGHVAEYLPTYQFYVVAGALAAVHLDEFDAWVRRHGWLVVGLGLASGLAAEAVYAASLRAGTPVPTASSVLQPVMVVWSAAVTLALYTLGSAWARRRRENRISGIVAELSLASFGVYLVHPLVLKLVLLADLSPGHHQVIPRPAATVAAFLLTAALSVAFTEMLLRTPLAVALTGRPRKDRRRPLATGGGRPAVDGRPPADGLAVVGGRPAAGDLPAAPQLAGTGGEGRP
jgi:peptidoglycan/LPS O-acetylase OafA/YrhL